MQLATQGTRWKRLLRDIVRSRYTYLFLLPGLIFYLIFMYVPMSGVILAFKKYNARLGIWGSPWVGLQNYEFVFRDASFFNALKNTLVISFCRILFQFPAPILIALIFNELRMPRYKRVLQTVYTFPNFLSWVMISGILVNFLGDTGALNAIIVALGGEKQGFLSNSGLFRALLYVTDIWKTAGWSSIIYMAAIAAISTEQYEAARIDGANRLQMIAHITLPCIKGTVIVMLLLQVGNIMNAGFDQIFNISNPAVRTATDILDTYIYRVTFEGSTDFGFSAAIGLFKSVVNFAMLVIFDAVSKLLGDRGLFY